MRDEVSHLCHTAIRNVAPLADFVPARGVPDDGAAQTPRAARWRARQASNLRPSA
jgi:hypothetical protein